MSCTTKHNHGGSHGLLIPALPILPAVLLGILAMSWGGVSPVLWGQQLAAWAVFAFLAWPLQCALRRIPAEIFAVLLLVPLAAALLGKEAGGARRWIDLGIFNVNAALLVLPALMAVLCCVKYPYPVLLIGAAALCVQPSLEQLIAFSAAAIPILWQRKTKLWTWGCVFLLAALVIQSARMPVTIEPVAYCEGIVAMLGEIAQPLQAVGWAVLAAVPACWLVFFRRRNKQVAVSVAVYYAASMLFALTGEYPVMFMGFGLSPIAGYYLAYLCAQTYGHEKKDA